MRVVVLTLAASACAIPAGSPPLASADPPDSAFALRNQDGVVVSLEALRGSPVILDIGVLW